MNFSDIVQAASELSTEESFFVFGDLENEHIRGDIECDVCHHNYAPTICKCGGVIHSEMLDCYDGYGCGFCCDKCGERSCIGC